MLSPQEEFSFMKSVLIRSYTHQAKIKKNIPMCSKEMGKFYIITLMWNICSNTFMEVHICTSDGQKNIYITLIEPFVSNDNFVDWFLRLRSTVTEINLSQTKETSPLTAHKSTATLSFFEKNTNFILTTMYIKRTEVKNATRRQRSL